MTMRLPILAAAAALAFAAPSAATAAGSAGACVVSGTTVCTGGCQQGWEVRVVVISGHARASCGTGTTSWCAGAGCTRASLTTSGGSLRCEVDPPSTAICLTYPTALG
ncbi:MAG TPA: hypothetical protein VNQ77_17040 [Frankiaceae bacterium]|nr:hypothetical protein [Frankiaceae bacterium]